MVTEEPKPLKTDQSQIVANKDQCTR
jgi:hypothetical protein